MKNVAIFDFAKESTRGGLQNSIFFILYAIIAVSGLVISTTSGLLTDAAFYCAVVFLIQRGGNQKLPIKNKCQHTLSKRKIKLFALTETCQRTDRMLKGKYCLDIGVKGKGAQRMEWHSDRTEFIEAFYFLFRLLKVKICLNAGKKSFVY